MSTKVITDPSALGWEQDGATANGTPIYKWAEGTDNEHPIAGGTQDGVLATWDNSANSGAGQWTPDSSVKVRPDIGMELTGSAGRLKFEPSGAKIRFSRDGKNYIQTGTGSNSSLVLGANDTETLTIDATGNATFTGTVNANKFVGDGSGLTGVGGGLGETLILRNENAPADNQKFALSVQSNGSINFQARDDSGAGGGSLFRMTRTGNSIDRLQCIRSGSAIAYWDVSTGSITAPDFIATSDERVKDNITTAPVGLIDSLKGREWDWKESGEKGSGVVAQELEQVLPHLVHTDDEGTKSVAYNGLVAYLIEEVKALRAEVEALK